MNLLKVKLLDWLKVIGRIQNFAKHISNYEFKKMKFLMM